MIKQKLDQLISGMTDVISEVSKNESESGSDFSDKQKEEIGRVAFEYITNDVDILRSFNDKLNKISQNNNDGESYHRGVKK
ncbi:hypothetical protein L4D09_28570 [Photobacterium makurazakiensis]|uniref:hypothetical protein n=1 Tax=Photobacterium makurazakiensis TaxID=2910234 RepID=UPI003D1018EE